MKKIIAIALAVLAVFAFAGCSNTGNAPSTGSTQPSATIQPSAQVAGDQEPNVWVVKDEAPVMDADTGKEAGRAFSGFALSLQSEKDGKAGFSINFLEKEGESVAQTKNYTIDTKYMEKKYVEPQATILIISVDMITIKAGGSLYDEKGNKLITFTDATGPFHFIQKTENGYMFTIDFNVVYAKEADVEYISVPIPQ